MYKHKVRYLDYDIIIKYDSTENINEVNKLVKNITKLIGKKYDN